MAKKKRTSQSFKHAVGAPLGATLQVPRVIIRSYGRRKLTSYTPHAQTFKTITDEKRSAYYLSRLSPSKPLDVRSVGKTLRKPIKPIVISPTLTRVRTDIRRPTVCESRSVRASVLHATGKTGSGAPKHKSSYKTPSKVTCK